MTGERTLRGRVLAIGGLKEKLLAAKRAGITRVLIPKENEKNLEEVPPLIRRALQIVPVDHMDQVLAGTFPGHFPVAVVPLDDGFGAAAEPPVHH